MTDEARSLAATVESAGRAIRLYHWPTDGQPRAVVQILHGLAEHAGRYRRFATALNAKGISVVAHDHRGHGPDAKASLGHFAKKGGWAAVIGDVDAVRRAIRSHLPDTPHALLGHSMGSYIAQSYVMRHPDWVERLILSGSTFPDQREVKAARAVAWLLSRVFGASSRANLLDRMSFGKFNDRFKPNRTPFDWLSRHEAEVDKYIDDPLCGGVSSNRLWFDLLGGLLEISDPEAIERIPASLPILITGGELDPVGGKAALSKLADRYRETGHSNVTLKLYAEGRHEMLNEINRDEVTADIVAWIDSTL